MSQNVWKKTNFICPKCNKLLMHIIPRPLKENWLWYSNKHKWCKEWRYSKLFLASVSCRNLTNSQICYTWDILATHQTIPKCTWGIQYQNYRQNNKVLWRLHNATFHKMSPVKRICVFEHSVMTNFNCACPAIQRGQGSGFLSEGSSWLTACMSKQRRFWRDCADAQARLNLRCSHRR